MGRKLNHREKCEKGETKTQTASFYKRRPTLMKKAKELQTLCDVLVCVVCFGPKGNVFVWPENHEDVKNIIMQYKGLANNLKKESNYLDLLQSKKKKLVKRLTKQKIDGLISSLAKKLDGLSGSSLMEFVNELEVEVENFKKRIDLLIREEKEKRKEEEKRKAIQVVNPSSCLFESVTNPSRSLFESVDDWLDNIDNWLGSNSTENSIVEFGVKSEILAANVNSGKDTNSLIPTDNQKPYLTEALPISVWSPGYEFW